MRISLLAVVGVTACGWALVRYYTHPRPPMTIEVVPASSTEIPAPELIQAP